MASSSSVCSLPAWLLVVLSVSSTATTDSLNATLNQHRTRPTTTTCSLNITNFEEMQRQFEEFRTIHKARIINIRISGIEWSSFKNESLEVFDPNWWVWTTDDFSPLLKMPVDYTALSFGLSLLAIMDLKVEFFSIPAGCERGLRFEQEIQIAMESILQLMGKAQNNDGLICRSVYSRPSLIYADSIVGVGKICCSREEILRPANHKRGRCCHHDLGHNHGHNVFSESSPFIVLVGVFLPFLVIPLAFEFFEYNPRSANEEFTEYLLNKRTKLAHFRLSGKCKEGETRKMAERTLLVKEDELIRYKGSANLRDLFKQGVRGVISGKIKQTLLFILQYIIVACWLGYYYNNRETLRRFDSADKIVFNLRNNPYSWIFTDSSLWPSVVGYVLILLHFSVIIQGTVWWLLEFELFRGLFVKYLRLSQKPEHRQRRFKKVKRLFDACFINAVAGSYLFVYSLFNSILYVIGGLIVSADIVATWATGGLLVVYYFHRSYSELVDSYTQVKRLVFQVCRDSHAYRAMHLETREIVGLNYGEKTIQDDKGYFIYENVKFEGPIWFVRESVKDCYNRPTPRAEAIRRASSTEKSDAIELKPLRDEDKGKEKGLRKTGVLEAMISKDMLRGVCKRIRPIPRRIRKAVVKLFFILLFLCLVMFTAAMFRPNSSKGEASIILASLTTLVAAMIPRLTEMMSTTATRGLRADYLKFKIEEILVRSRPKFMVKKDTEKGSEGVPVGIYTTEGSEGAPVGIYTTEATKVKGTKGKDFTDGFNGDV